MNYKVLYRKYRPDNFENIIGQDYIIKTLKNSIINNNISHAYIFSGPRGTGKTSTAKVFAKAINCLNPVDGSPCGKCDFCSNFAENPDIIEIDAASNNGVDEIRALIDNIKLTPTNGKYKVYIIDEVHMLTTSAFNALLLTLEEPPAHSIFILATTNIENVPITILSRCQRFDFQKITVENIVNRLQKICEIENIDVDAEALEEIAYLSEGSMRDALSLLDQLSKNKQKITLEIIENQIKIISQKGIKELIECLELNDIERLLSLINDYRMRAVDYKTLVKKIIEVASKNAKNIILKGRVKRLNFIDYKKLIFNLSESLVKINVNVDAFIILEMTLLELFDKNNMSESELSTSSLKILDNSEKEVLENKLSDDTVNNDLSTLNIDEKLIDIRINNCFVDAKKSYLDESKLLIEKLKNDFNIDGKVKNILLDSQVVAASSQNLIFTCSNIHEISNANSMLSEIESEITAKIKTRYKIIFISPERWEEERSKYILNIKNNKKYKYIEEKASENGIIINDVFDLNKVEII